MIEIESNKQAWGKISEEHYHYFKALLSDDDLHLNHYIQEELGDISGKEIIHLQCNTGADTLILAKTAKSVVGVDLVPDNIFFANKLAGDLNFKNVKFIEADIMNLSKFMMEIRYCLYLGGSIGMASRFECMGEYHSQPFKG